MVTIRPREAQRGLDTGSVPNTTRDDSVGQGLRSLGSAVSQAGETASSFAARLEQQKQQIADFEAEQQWQRTQLQIAAQYDQAKLNIDPSGAGFAEASNKVFISQYDQFLASVPESLRPKFTELVATDREARLALAAADEVDQRNRWYEVGVQDTVNLAQTGVANNPDAFDQRLADVHRTIDATGLPPSKKTDLKRQAADMLGRAWFERTMRDDPAFAKTQLGVGVTGTDRDAYFAAIRAAESGGNDAARNPRSSATGRYQFTVGTWKQLVKDNPGAGLTEDGRLDPRQQEVAIRLFTASNEQALAAAGIAPTNANLYAAHFLGAQGAVAALRADENTPMAAVVGPEVMKANPFLADMTVGQFRLWTARKAGANVKASGEPAPQVANLPFDERVKLYDQAVAAEKALLTAETAQQKAAYEAQKGALELAIQKGEVASQQSILDAGLSDGDTATMLSKWQTQQGKDASARLIVDAFANGSAVTANPYDADQRRAVNDGFDLLMKSTPAEQRDLVTGEYIRATGVVPDSVVADVRQGLNATDVVAVARAMQLAAALNDVAPQSLATVDNGKEIVTAAATYSEMVSVRGMSAEQAAAEMLKARDPANQKQAKQLDDAWDQAIKDKTFNTSDVLAQFDAGWFGGGQPSAGVTPAQTAALTADYLDAAERAFKGQANGDPALAKTIAVNEMKRTYGVSANSGSRVLMKYPPENFYPARAGGHDYVRDLALIDARTLYPEATNVMLVSSPETAADVRSGAAPRYNLMYQREDGIWDMAPDLFMVGPEMIDPLASLDSEEREVRFALEQQEQAWRAANPRAPSGGLAPLVQMIGEAATGRGFTPDPALTERLQQIQSERITMLGKDPARNEMATSDPLEAERRFLEQRSSAYGAAGGAM